MNIDDVLVSICVYVANVADEHGSESNRAAFARAIACADIRQLACVTYPHDRERMRNVALGAIPAGEWQSY